MNLKDSKIKRIDLANFDIYTLNHDAEKIIWDECVFVFDSSALLDIYLLPDKTRKSIFDEIFKAKIKDRLWIPSHVEFEYLKNREKVIEKPIKEKYQPLNDDIISHLDSNIKDSITKIKALKDRTKKDDTHPHIDEKNIADLESSLNKYVEAHNKFKLEFDQKIESVKKEITELRLNDTILKNLQKYFKKGRYYSFDEIISICEDGQRRYSMTIPPGYMDQQGKNPKIGTQIYGDLIIWKQILEYAKEDKTNIVFITNDVTKGDWCIWDEKKKKVITPRQELLKEFFDITGKRIWIYSLDDFMYKSKEVLKADVSSDQIKQAINIFTFNRIQILNEGTRLFLNLIADQPQKIALPIEANIQNTILNFQYSRLYDKRRLYLTFYNNQQESVQVSITLEKDGYTSFQLEDDDDILNQTFRSFDIQCNDNISLAIKLEKLDGGFM